MITLFLIFAHNDLPPGSRFPMTMSPERSCGFPPVGIMAYFIMAGPRPLPLALNRKIPRQPENDLRLYERAYKECR
ncbi:MAG: hypothetical protein R3C11_07680 [Planctomycetaceae bacterium]